MIFFSVQWLSTVIGSPTVWLRIIFWYSCTVLNCIWPLQYLNPVEMMLFQWMQIYYWISVCPFSSLSSLKLECEKLASEKTEMQRHYIMVSTIRSLSELYGYFFWSDWASQAPWKDSVRSLHRKYIHIVQLYLSLHFFTCSSNSFFQILFWTLFNISVLNYFYYFAQFCITGK